jgi:hypothetical protein
MVYEVIEDKHCNNPETGVMADQKIKFTGKKTKKNYPDPIRRVVFYDKESNRTFVFYTNNFDMSAENVALGYKYRWRIELFWKWLKQHLHVKEFFGTTENAVKIQLYVAIITYCLVAIAEKRMKIDMDMYDMLRILSISLLERDNIRDMLIAMPQEELNKEFIESKLYKGAVEEACKEPVAKQDLERHDRKNVPAWKILESMTFGTTIKIFENLKEEDLKRHISKEFGIVSYKQFFNYVNALRRLRNYCAHGKVLFDLNLSNSICNGPAGNLDSIKSRLAGAYRILEYMLNRVSTNRKTDLVNSINRIFNKIEDAEVKRVIYNSTGFKPNI